MTTRFNTFINEILSAAIRYERLNHKPQYNAKNDKFNSRDNSNGNEENKKELRFMQLSLKDMFKIKCYACDKKKHDKRNCINKVKRFNFNKERFFKFKDNKKKKEKE